MKHRVKENKPLSILSVCLQLCGHERERDSVQGVDVAVQAEREKEDDREGRGEEPAEGWGGAL